MPAYSMNLDEQYVEKWGAWEVAREIICNAKDADPKYSIKVHSKNFIEVETTTTPSIEELMIIGAGSSRNDDEKIGQFGEGFKMAALVTTRMKGDLTCLTPHGKLTFTLVKPSPTYSSRVLYAHLDKRSKTKSKCVIRLKLEGIAAQLDGSFINTDTPLIEKPGYTPCKVYVKGVYITELESKSVFDWNLKSTEINRDRSFVDVSIIKLEIGRAFFRGQHSYPIEHYSSVLKNKECLELDCLARLYSLDEPVKEKLKTAFHDLFGEKAVIASEDARANETAFIKGYKPIYIQENLRLAGIKTADHIVSEHEKFVAQKIDVDKRFYDEANLIMDILEVPSEVSFFKHDQNAGDLLGRAIIKDGVAHMWLCESLTGPGKRLERLGTIIHELSHISSKMTDGSILFEYEQSQLCAKVLNHYLVSKGV